PSTEEAGRPLVHEDSTWGTRGAPPPLMARAIVLAPFIHVAEHVEHAEVVGEKAPARQGAVAAVRLIARIPGQQPHRGAVIPARLRACAAGVLPLRVRRQTIAR